MTAHTGIPPVPKHKLIDADRATLRGNPLVRAPLASGPFKIEKWLPNEKIVLVPNEAYTGPDEFRPNLSRIIFKILPEYATRLVELENGSTDVAEAILVADADRLRKEHPELTMRRRGWRSMDYVAWNRLDFEDYKAKKDALTESNKALREAAKGEEDAELVLPELDWATVAEHHIFGDLAVRKAFAKAVDVDGLMARLMTSETGEVYAKRSVSTITPALCDVHNNSITPIPFNVAEANADLEAAGWIDKDGDGIREKNGRDLAFTLMTNTGNARRAKAAIIMQAQLRTVGAMVEIETVESNTFFERLRKKDFESALAGWAAGLFVDMSTMWKSGDQYEFNFPSYHSPEADALIDQALAEPDPEKNAVLWKTVQEMIYEDQPYMFLYWMDEIVGVHGRFESANVNVMSPFHEIWAWSVAPDQVKY
jgi:peptide/nickel transport system substrate-binding protein